mmetsp:Transcript_4905/g.15523  ORF Transcript_4905/g.15523 Transcript_4905/m.15523 type:complete len:290 (-) Transcript_4905:39-908(-)
MRDRACWAILRFCNSETPPAACATDRTPFQYLLLYRSGSGDSSSAPFRSRPASEARLYLRLTGWPDGSGFSSARSASRCCASAALARCHAVVPADGASAGESTAAAATSADADAGGPVLAAAAKWSADVMADPGGCCDEDRQPRFEASERFSCDLPPKVPTNDAERDRRRPLTSFFVLAAPSLPAPNDLTSMKTASSQSAFRSRWCATTSSRLGRLRNAASAMLHQRPRRTAAFFCDRAMMAFLSKKTKCTMDKARYVAAKGRSKSCSSKQHTVPEDRTTSAPRPADRA